MPPKIYIDGQAGTTALRIRDWLAGRTDLEVVTLPEGLRKDPAARKQALRDAAVVLLCLPDDASRAEADWLADSPVRILDASTAHRVADDWVYGLPELVAGQRERIAKAQRVSNPGCYPSAAILLLRPLVGKSDTFLPGEKKFFLSHWQECLASPAKAPAAEWRTRPLRD